MTDEATTARLLAMEIEALRRDPTAASLTFCVGPFEAYSLVAVLQLASRHPSLSEQQLAIVLELAHQVADALTARAVDVVGPDSAIAWTVAQGFDPEQDVPETDDPEDLDDGSVPLDIGPGEDALGVSESGARYVSPTWVHLPGDDEGELSKCAACSRFFVSEVPFRLLTSNEDGPVLGMEICDGCASAVMGVRISRPGGGDGGSA